MSSRSEKSLIREVGNWVSGDRFFNRKHELAAFVELLDEGAHILLVAPRRTGKTSLMREAGQRIADRYHAVFVDLEKSRSAEDAVVELGLATREHERLWDKTLRVFENVLGKVAELQVDEFAIKFREGVTGDWKVKGDRLLASLAETERPVALFLDEVPILINRMLKTESGAVRDGGRDEADMFVSWLRSACQTHRGRLRVVVTGSIGLEPVLEQAGLSAAVNQLTPFFLEPWPAQTALECLGALANNYELHFEEGAAEAMVERLGCAIPHHVQLFFSHVYEDARHRESAICRPADVERVYQRRMVGTRGHAELSHYEERLRLVLGAQRLPLALDILTEAALGTLTAEAARVHVAEHVAESAQRGKVLRDLVSILEHDGYLRRSGDRYVFISNLVRDWWRGRFEFGFVSAVERSK